MGNAIIKVSNLRKAFYYLKKNGLKNAYYAAMERMGQEKAADYHYCPPDENKLQKQREEADGFSYTFSILVPAYETDPSYLREMTDSVLNQTYSRLELIVADASMSDTVKKVLDTYEDSRLRYVRVPQNKGISANTNAALAAAEGDYIGLLDHDDVLTPDALYEMARAIGENEKKGCTAWLLYSDEDKGNGDCTAFYEPHFKQPLNVDMLLSNNYICHFLVIKKELMKELRLRPEYDGAQDFDLVLRAVGELLYERRKGRESVVHVPKVLYHWRCHTGSTAENPASKRYAYDAGRRAAEDFMKSRGWKGTVEDTLHLGFYRISYEKSIFEQRPEVGVLGGKLLDTRNRIAGGIYDEKSNPAYEGLRKEYSGYMHRASISQEAYAVDVRCMKVRRELRPMFEEIFGVRYEEDGRTGYFAYGKLNHENTEKVNKTEKANEIEGTEKAAEAWKEKSIAFCREVRAAGYTVVFTPDVMVKL